MKMAGVMKERAVPGGEGPRVARVDGQVVGCWAAGAGWGGEEVDDELDGPL